MTRLDKGRDDGAPTAPVAPAAPAAPVAPVAPTAPAAPVAPTAPARTGSTARVPRRTGSTAPARPSGRTPRQPEPFVCRAGEIEQRHGWGAGIAIAATMASAAALSAFVIWVLVVAGHAQPLKDFTALDDDTQYMTYLFCAAPMVLGGAITRLILGYTDDDD